MNTWGHKLRITKELAGPGAGKKVKPPDGRRLALENPANLKKAEDRKIVYGFLVNSAWEIALNLESLGRKPELFFQEFVKKYHEFKAQTKNKEQAVQSLNTFLMFKKRQKKGLKVVKTKPLGHAP